MRGVLRVLTAVVNALALMAVGPDRTGTVSANADAVLLGVLARLNPAQRKQILDNLGRRAQDRDVVIAESARVALTRLQPAPQQKQLAVSGNSAKDQPLDQGLSSASIPGTKAERPQQQGNGVSRASKLDGQGFTFDVFYCDKASGDKGNPSAYDIASRLRNVIAEQRNIGAARLRSWPVRPGYEIIHPFEIRVTERRKALASKLKILLDKEIASTEQEFSFVDVSTDFPQYISIVVCPALTAPPPASGQ
jgi:hypothetical protein